MATNKKILIVDDEMFLARMLGDRLREEGFSVDFANDGVEGLEKIVAGRPDLVLLDLVMPRMDGTTMLEKLRADDRAKSVPVIVLSNINNAKIAEELRAKGAQGYLVKVNNTLADIAAAAKDTLLRA